MFVFTFHDPYPFVYIFACPAQAMLSLLENANKICATENARVEYSKSLASSSSSPSSGDAGASAGEGGSIGDAATTVTTLSAPPALESMLIYTKFRGLGFRMRELGYMLRCSELAEEDGGGRSGASHQHGGAHSSESHSNGNGNGNGSSSGLRVSAVLDPTKSAYSSEDFLNHFNTSRHTSAGRGCLLLPCLLLCVVLFVHSGLACLVLAYPKLF